MSLQNEEIPCGPRLRHGLLWWWIEAPSAEAIIQTYAEVMIVEPADGEAEIRGHSVASHWRSCASGLMIWRNAPGSAGQPEVRALVGRGSVYIRKDYPEEQETYFFEYDEQGIARAGCCVGWGEAERSGPADWVFNPPEDGDPELAECEIAREEFEGGGESAANGLIAFEKF